jgi:nucleoid-associated protein YgaU
VAIAITVAWTVFAIMMATRPHDVTLRPTVAPSQSTTTQAAPSIAALPDPAPSPQAGAPRELPPSAAVGPVHYIVQPGDCLWSLAFNFYGDHTAYHQLASHNHIANPSLIYPGQVLEIP